MYAVRLYGKQSKRYCKCAERPPKRRRRRRSLKQATWARRTQAAAVHMPVFEHASLASAPSLLTSRVRSPAASRRAPAASRRAHAGLTQGSRRAHAVLTQGSRRAHAGLTQAQAGSRRQGGGRHTRAAGTR
eukprot:2868678-Prymnesium_polylepis.1